MKRYAFFAVIVLAFAVACGGAGRSVSGTITAGNILDLLTTSEVNEHAREGTNVDSTVVDRMQSAIEIAVENLGSIESWTEVDYGERPDGGRVKFTVIDHTDNAAANARFDLVISESGLVESDQNIGDRFAGLAPQSSGIHTVVLVLVGDKTVLMTTVLTFTDQVPLVDSEGLVELSRLVAPRILP
ncbi:MAG: hypothetical protein O3B84_05425 [Chloroflexi bacterium]|nr:hypothetical protein [Chloroflexota bacterium]